MSRFFSNSKFHAPKRSDNRKSPPMKTNFRHSRESGNPSPEQEFITPTFFLWMERVMDSRLRGNDEVFMFSYEASLLTLLGAIQNVAEPEKLCQILFHTKTQRHKEGCSAKPFQISPRCPCKRCAREKCAPRGHFFVPSCLCVKQNSISSRHSHISLRTTSSALLRHNAQAGKGAALFNPESSVFPCPK